MRRIIGLSLRNNGLIRLGQDRHTSFLRPRQLEPTSLLNQSIFRCCSQSHILYSPKKSSDGNTSGFWDKLTGGNGRPLASGLTPKKDGSHNSKQTGQAGPDSNKQSRGNFSLGGQKSTKQNNLSGQQKSKSVSKKEVRSDDMDNTRANQSRDDSGSKRVSSRKKSRDDLQDEPSSSHHASNVRQDKKSCKFYLDLGQGKQAFIDYRRIDGKKGNVIEMYHTEVPGDLRGRGIGKVLAKGALIIASQANFKCHLTCSYLIDYRRRYADESELNAIVDS